MHRRALGTVAFVAAMGMSLACEGVPPCPGLPEDIPSDWAVVPEGLDTALWDARMSEHMRKGCFPALSVVVVDEEGEKLRAAWGHRKPRDPGPGHDRHPLHGGLRLQGRRRLGPGRVARRRTPRFRRPGLQSRSLRGREPPLGERCANPHSTPGDAHEWHRRQLGDPGRHLRRWRFARSPRCLPRGLLEPRVASTTTRRTTSFCGRR